VLLCCINVRYSVVDTVRLAYCLLSPLCCLPFLNALFSATIFRLSINYIFDELVLIVLKFLVLTSVCSTGSSFVVRQASSS
jgi:hypothetical protein